MTKKAWKPPPSSQLQSELYGRVKLGVGHTQLFVDAVAEIRRLRGLLNALVKGDKVTK